jgi:hypothetical protein
VRGFRRRFRKAFGLEIDKHVSTDFSKIAVQHPCGTERASICPPKLSCLLEYREAFKNMANPELADEVFARPKHVRSGGDLTCAPVLLDRTGLPLAIFVMILAESRLSSPSVLLQPVCAGDFLSNLHLEPAKAITRRAKSWLSTRGGMRGVETAQAFPSNDTVP